MPSTLNPHLRSTVREAALRLHDDPECSGDEVRAAGLLAGILAEAGFEVDPVAGVPTAFRARHRGDRPGPHIAILAEYDALPEIGHGCGHHLVAGAALAAGLQLAGHAPSMPGTVSVLGCPAEETLTGKRAMLEAGAFDGVDVALTFHPSGATSIMTGSTGLRRFRFEFHGLAAHASSDPWDGASALDGVIALFTQVNALRQFARDRTRIHGVITNGGSAWNVIPEYASCVIGVRSDEPAELDRIADRLRDCAQAAALGSSTSVTIEEEASAAPVRLSEGVARIVRSALEDRGHQVGDWDALASTDFGDVSQTIPSVLFSVASWPADVPFHTRRATDAGGHDMALAAMVEAGEVMAEAALTLLQTSNWKDDA